MIDITNLAEKLENLTGYDMEQCEKEERLTGNAAMDLTLSKSFQARLAAKALGCNPYDIKELPLKKYSQVVTQVTTFLFAPSVTESTPLPTSEN